MKDLEQLTLEPPTRATACVIWLHGLGANGHDFEPVVPRLELGDAHSVRFIFPHAPIQKVTLNAGMAMPAWFDLFEISKHSKQDEPGIRAAQRHIENLITQQIQAGIVSSNIILAGFSQGGALALHTGLRFAETLGGIIALSTYLPLADTVEAEASKANQQTPILMAHGINDPVLPLDFGQTAEQALTHAGYQVQWRTYPMEHYLCPQEITDIAHWLKARLFDKTE